MQKYCVIAISLLAVLLLAGPSVWATNGSTYVSDTIPTTMVAGTLYTPTVTMQNTGTSTWTDGAGPADYNFAPPDGVPNNPWGGRVDSGGVAPGASKVFTINVTPTEPGVYACQWQMVQESVEWFGAICTKTITVTGASGAPAAGLGD